MKGLDLRNFKKVATDQKSSTFKNNKGAEIKISHAGLSQSHLKQLNALPLHSEEGNVIPEPTETPSPMPTPPPQEQVNTLPSDQQNIPVPHALPGPQENADSLDSGAGEPAENLPDQGAFVTGREQAAAMPSGKSEVEKAISQGKTGLEQQRAVDSRLSQAYAHLDENRIKSQTDLVQDFHNNAAQLKEYHDNFIKDFGSGHINPNQYLENMKVGSKIASAIGLFLGGIGSAYTHQGNPALDFLNKQIDRDIEAQKAGANNKMNLYHANLAFFKDQNVALNETRAQLHDIYLTQMKQAADQLGTPAAQSRYNLAASDFGIKTAGLQQQDATRKTIMDQINRTGGQGLTPLSLEAAGLIPHEQAVKEANSIEGQRNSIKQVNYIFDQLAKEQTPANFANLQSKARRDALYGQLTQVLLKSDETKRLTPESVAQEITPFRQKTWDNQKTVDQAKDAVFNIVASGAAPTPYTSQLAPAAVPLAPYQTYNKMRVGDITKVKGQPVQIINQQGHFRPVK